MRRFKLWASLVLVVLVIGAGLYGWWALDLRWRPKTIRHNQAEISKILDESGWVSPGGKAGKLYMVSYRTCPDCIRYKEVEFPKLHAAGVDTRVIMIARADKNGVERSTPIERATVAELWANRQWSLLESWMGVPPEAWAPTGMPPADGDAGRTAMVNASRDVVEDLTKLMKPNGVEFAYPLLIWWTADGEMHGCACEKAETYANVRRELGL